ncbi:unnamed protein product [Paramecium octaurelia]|uniref:Uncharacterized protein n=1 Tax=Paramecium octaurelia TaxID=43137 RepID=A0A8S1VDE2_PAROT|nr:unnamed protein product [Paramecium octaurelia]
MGCGQSSASFFESRGLIYIYYGTTSGNSSRLAFQFASQTTKMNYLPKMNLNLIKQVRRSWLRFFCDFTGLITKKQLMELSNQVVNKQHKEELLKAASFEGREFYDENFNKMRENLLTQLLEICPSITPRFFTIASSNMKHPKNIHILAGQLVLYEKKIGLCSQYFSNLKKGSLLKGYLQDSKFAFPKSPKAPVLLIGPGAGLAPMRAFIQERDYYFESNNLEKSPLLGNMELLFGCRTEDEYCFEEERYFEKFESCLFKEGCKIICDRYYGFTLNTFSFINGRNHIYMWIRINGQRYYKQDTGYVQTD